MGTWWNERADEWTEFTTPNIEVTVSDNPVTHELLDHHGNVIRQWTARPPIGFR